MKMHSSHDVALRSIAIMIENGNDNTSPNLPKSHSRLGEYAEYTMNKLGITKKIEEACRKTPNYGFSIGRSGKKWVVVRNKAFGRFDIISKHDYEIEARRALKEIA